MDELIRRQAAVDMCCEPHMRNADCSDFEMEIMMLPSEQSKTSRIENALHGKSAEEQYDFLRWLMQDYGMQFTDTRVAVIEWLRGEKDG